VVIPIAVVGAGFGVRTQVPGFRASGRFEVVALVGRDPDRTRKAAALAGVPRVCTNLDEALAIPGLRAVSIATPPAAHATQVITAARAGKHVLCEKPMARTLAEAEAMRVAVVAAGVVGLVDHEFRFHPGRAMLGRVVARGDLGVPALVSAVDTIPLYVAPHRPPPAWWFDADAGGGWLGASGSHLVDGVRVWVGEIASVAAMVETLAPEPRRSADDTFSMLFRTTTGVHGVLQQSAAVHGPRIQLLRIAGSEGTAWLDERWTLWRVGRSGEPEQVTPDADLAPPAVDIPAWAGPFAAREVPSFVRQAKRFADAIEGRTSTGDPRVATFDDGVAVQRVMDAARESSRSARWVDVGG
jgi:predicted dehydrogenase